MTHGFIVLPDLAGADRAVQAAPVSAPQLIRHPSGRPWVMGHWAPDEVTSVITGSVRVVVAGICPVTTTRLAELAGPLRGSADVEAIARTLPGSFHLMAAAGDWTLILGSASGLRRVFYAHVGGVPVAGDRPDMLAAMTGAAVDEQALA